MSEPSLRYFPDRGDGIALFCNVEGAGGFSELMNSITDLLLELQQSRRPLVQ